MAQRKAASECCIHATNLEDRERFADEEYRIAQEMDQIRKEIIENNIRRK